MILTPDDITAIADAVAARLGGALGTAPTAAQRATTITYDAASNMFHVGGIAFTPAPDGSFYRPIQPPAVLGPYPGKDDPTPDAPFGWGTTPDGHKFRKGSQYDLGN